MSSPRRLVNSFLAWPLIVLLCFGALLSRPPAAHAAIEQLAIWSFDGNPVFTVNTPINPTTDDVVDTPTLRLINADVASNGVAGVAYTDSKGVAHPAGQAAGWTDIAKSGANDADLRLQINTTAWQDLKLRLDYRSDLANNYDLEYSFNETDWTKALDNQALTTGAVFQALTIDLPPAVANQPSVFLRIIDLDNGPGNNGFYFDNLELTGNRISPNAPTIQVAASTTRFLALPATGSGFASGVISDPTDPAAVLGIDFTLSDPDTPLANLTVTTTSNNPAVVANTGLALSGSGATRNLKITPAGVGYARITLTVQDTSANTTSYVIDYAASAAAVAGANAQFPTGMSDASAAIAVDADTMLVANDEDQPLRLYSRSQSGLPLASFDFTPQLGLNAGGGEVDIEGATRVGDRLFWLSSHGNNSSGDPRPNRQRLFATDLSGTGAAATLSFVGRYDSLRSDMINWDAGNGHGLGANYLGLLNSTSTGIAPESPAGNGFNIEGLALAPGSTTTAYVGFRAPLTPASNRTKALIIPVTNFSTILSNAGGPANAATFGAPIELDLGGRGIRSIERNASNQYLIIAGPVAEASGIAPSDFRLYTWTGNPADAPQLQPVDLTARNSKGSFEGIVDVPNPLSAAEPVQLINDNGGTDWYGDAKESKTLTTNFQKFRTEQVKLLFAPTATTVAATEITPNSAQLNGSVSANGASTVVRFEWGSTPGGPYPNQLIAAQSPLTGVSATPVSALLPGLSANTTYYYRVVATNSLGQATGTEQTFTTTQSSANAPSATTTAATEVTPNSAQLNGSVSANGASTVVRFEWGSTPGGPYPNQLVAAQSPLTGVSATPVSALLLGLAANTTYYYRVVATSSGGTALGGEQSVTTSQSTTPTQPTGTKVYLPLLTR